MAERELPDIKKTDRRSQRTKDALSAGLYSLLENIEFRKITVNDICAAANVSRPTFYTYYEDKYSLLNYCIDIFFSDIIYQSMEEGISDLEHVEQIIDRLDQHRNFLANCFYPGIKNSDAINIAFLPAEHLPSEIRNFYHIGGAIMVFCWWAFFGKKMSRTQLIAQLTELLEHDNDPVHPG